MRSTPPCLEQTWRWFGPGDPIPLRHIRQSGATGIVTGLYGLPNGAVWPIERIRQRKDEIERAGLRWSVAESLPVHEDIKQAKRQAGLYLDNYSQSLRHLAANGIKVVCYNFMPLLDWTRTDLAWKLPDGAETLRFDVVDAALFDLYILKRERAASSHSSEIMARAAKRFADLSVEQTQVLTRSILLGTPGTVQDLQLEGFRGALAQYRSIDSAQLRENHAAFLHHVVPVAEECGVSLCLHPDDPPFSIFGLPCIAGNLDDLLSILAAVDSPHNGITFCAGALGANPANELSAIFRQIGHRVHFLHLRNVCREADGSFYEAAHLGGGIDMAVVMLAILEELDRRADSGGKASMPMCPDHAHRMLGDLGHDFYPGYSAIGRLKGLAELRGLEIGVRHMQRKT